MRPRGLTTKAGRLAIFLLAAAFCLPAFSGVLYVPVSPTVVAQTEDHYRLGRKVSEDPFGNFRTEDHPGGQGCTSESLTCNAPYTYTGHLYDQESGLFYFGARYYDPETGRFLSQDPVAGDALNPPSLHKYLYAYSSPMNYTDPWGEYAVVGYDEQINIDPNNAFSYNPAQIEGMRNYVKIATSSKGRYADQLTPQLSEALKNLDSSLLQPGVYAANWSYFGQICDAYRSMFSDTRQQNSYGFIISEDHNIKASVVTDGMEYAKAAKGYFVNPVVGAGEGLGELGAKVYEGHETALRDMERFSNNAHQYGVRRAIQVEKQIQGERLAEATEKAKAGANYIWSGQAVSDTLNAAANDPEKAGELTFSVATALIGGAEAQGVRAAKQMELVEATADTIGSITPRSASEVVKWVDEGGDMRAGKLPGMRSKPYEYQSSALGARSNRISGRSQAPQLGYMDAEGNPLKVKFDSLEGNVFIDRKLSIHTAPKTHELARRQSEALAQHGFLGRWEVPSASEAARAKRLMAQEGVMNILVKVVPK